MILFFTFKDDSLVSVEDLSPTRGEELCLFEVASGLARGMLAKGRVDGDESGAEAVVEGSVREMDGRRSTSMILGSQRIERLARRQRSQSQVQRPLKYTARAP